VTGLGEGGSSAGLRPGDHACALYFGARQRQRVLVAMVQDALDAGEQCLCRVGAKDARFLRAHFGPAQVGDGGDHLVVDSPHRGPPGDVVPTRVVTDLAAIADADGEHDEAARVTVYLEDVERLDLAGLVDLCTRHSKVVLGRRAIPGPRSETALSRRRPAGTPWQTLSAPGVQEGILVVSSLMRVAGHEREVATLAALVIDALDTVSWRGMVVVGRGWQLLETGLGRRDARRPVEAQLRALGAEDGQLMLPGVPWSWGFSLGRPDGSTGHLVVGAEAPPSPDDLFLVRMIAQLAGNAVTHLRASDRTRALRGELERARIALEETAELLDWCTVVRERFHEVVLARSGPQGIALAIQDMTGQIVEIEDRDGRRWAWAGGDGPMPRRLDADERTWLLDRAQRASRPFWHDGNLIAPARSGEEVVGLVTLVDADRELAEGELMALEDGATLVALELAHLREVSEVETRLGRDLLNELIEGRDPASVVGRAQALGCDVERAYRLVLIEPREAGQVEVFLQAVRRVVRDAAAGPLLTIHDRRVAVLALADVDWEELRDLVADEPGGGACRIAVGGLCRGAGDIPGSLRQAQLGLRLQEVLGGDDRIMEFERLGIYRLLAELAETGGVERYVEEWLRPLQPLLDYDERHRSELVETLSAWVEWGGRQDAAARALNVHRSTLKYRLQRIKAISGWDITDPELLFNLQLATRALRTLAAISS